MIQLVGFDLDGTLVDSVEDVGDAVNAGLKSVGLPLRSREDYLSYMGTDLNDFVQMAMNPVEDDQIREQIKIEFERYYHNHCCDKSKLFPGIRTLCNTLQQQGKLLFVLSNKQTEFVVQILNKLLPEISFIKILGDCEEYPSKPDPTGFLMLQKELNIDSKNCIYLGDSDIDIIMAKQASVRSFGCTWGYMKQCVLEKAGADYIINTPQQGIDLIYSL